MASGLGRGGPPPGVVRGPGPAANGHARQRRGRSRATPSTSWALGPARATPGSPASRHRDGEKVARTVKVGNGRETSSPRGGPFGTMGRPRGVTVVERPPIERRIRREPDEVREALADADDALGIDEAVGPSNGELAADAAAAPPSDAMRWRTAGAHGNAALQQAAAEGVQAPPDGNAALADAHGEGAAEEPPPVMPEAHRETPRIEGGVEATAGDPWQDAEVPDATPLLAGPGPAGPVGAGEGDGAPPGGDVPGGAASEEATGPAGGPASGTASGTTDAAGSGAPGGSVSGQAGALAGDGQATVQAVAAAATARTAQVQQAGAAAAEQLTAGVEAEVASLHAGIAERVQALGAAAEAEIARVRQAFADARATVSDEASTARAAIEADASTRITGLQAAREQASARVRALYGEMQAAARAAGRAVADEARGHAALAYEPVGDRHEDDLADRRATAWREATGEVGEGYAEAIVAEADQVAATIPEGIPTDLEAVSGTAQRAIEGVEAQRDRALADVAARESADLAALDRQESEAVAGLEGQRDAACAALEEAGGTGEGQLREALAARLTQIDGHVAATGQALADAAAQIQGHVQDGLGRVGATLAEVPEGTDPAALQPHLDAARGRLSEVATRATTAFDGLAGDALSTLSEATGQALTDATALGAAILQAVGQGADDAASALTQAADQAVAGAQQVAQAAGEALRGLTEAARTAFATQAEGFDAAFAQLEQRLVEGSAANVTALTEALRASVQAGEVAGKAREEGRAAAESVQPWWKSALKWVAIIAITLVIAVVIGPLVIGALAPLVASGAAALGASAAAASVVGVVVAGAVVGAAGGYVTNGAVNLIEGRGFNEGALTAVATGALGGALGAGILSAVSRYAAPVVQSFAGQVAVDVVSDTITQIVSSVVVPGAQGLTWESLAQGILVGLVTNGVGRVGPTSRARTRMGEVGEGVANRVRPGAVDAFQGGMQQVTGGRNGLRAGAPPDGADATVRTTPAEEGTPSGAARGTDAATTPDGPARGSESAQEVAPRGADSEGGATGRVTARDLGYPDAPDGYTWVARDGQPPYLRRLPRPTSPRRALRYDPDQGVFVDVDSGTTLRTGADVDAFHSARDAALARQPDAEGPTTPRTGRQAAADLGYPDAPEGYTWVARDGTPPFLRRAPGRATDLRPIRFDASRGVFEDVQTGQTFRTPGEVVAYNEVRLMPKADRPDPSTYLPADKTTAHLAGFEDGASYLVPKSALDRYGRALLGRPDNSQFVMTGREMDALLARARGDVAVVEAELGIPAGAWQGKALVRIDVPSPRDLDLRMPSGREDGANALWLPGGKLPTGQDEAVVNQIPEGQYRETVVFGDDP